MFAGMNYGILLGAALVRFGFAFIWYGYIVPKQWKAAMKESKRDTKKIDKQKSMFASFGVAVVMSYVLYHLIGYMDLYTFRDGAMFAGFLWLGLSATLEFESIFYEGKSQRLFAINSGYQLISVMLMGGVLAMWR